MTFATNIKLFFNVKIGFYIDFGYKILSCESWEVFLSLYNQDVSTYLTLETKVTDFLI